METQLMFVFIGMALLLICNTFVAQAGLAPPRPFKFNAAKGTWRWWVMDIVLVYMRSCVSLVGILMMWSGGYTLLDVYCTFIDGVWKQVLFFSIGMFLMIWTGCFLSEAGFDPYYSSGQSPDDELSFLQNVQLHLQSVLAHLGCIMYWVASWNLLDAYILPYSLSRDLVLMITGLFCLMLSNTLVTSAGVIFERRPGPGGAVMPDDERQNANLFSCHTTSSCVLKYVRVFVSLLAGVLNWLGWWNFLCYDISAEPTDAQQAGYFILGLFCLIITNTFFTNFGVISPLSLTPDRQVEIVHRQAEIERQLIRRNSSSGDPFDDDEEDREGDASSLWKEEM